MVWAYLAMIALGVFLLLAAGAVVIVEDGGWPGRVWMWAVAGCFLAYAVSVVGVNVTL
jgi:hypothetical protein